MTNALREDLPAPPARIAALPVDRRGFPVPRFVALVDGQPDHRVANAPFIVQALKLKLCWICGQPLGAFQSFVVGPMSCISRCSAEPPSHRDCATYATQACPFLSKPHAHRRDAGLPADTVAPVGEFMPHNPTVQCIWTTRDYKAEGHRHDDGTPGLLFRMGEPTSMHWMHRGQPATRDQVVDAIAAGLPRLQDLADQDGPRAVLQLGQMTGELLLLIDRYQPGDESAVEALLQATGARP